MGPRGSLAEVLDQRPAGGGIVPGEDWREIPVLRLDHHPPVGVGDEKKAGRPDADLAEILPQGGDRLVEIPGLDGLVGFDVHPQADKHLPAGQIEVAAEELVPSRARRGELHHRRRGDVRLAQAHHVPPDLPAFYIADGIGIAVVRHGAVLQDEAEVVVQGDDGHALRQAQASEHGGKIGAVGQAPYYPFEQGERRLDLHRLFHPEVEQFLVAAADVVGRQGNGVAVAFLRFFIQRLADAVGGEEACYQRQQAEGTDQQQGQPEFGGAGLHGVRIPAVARADGPSGNCQAFPLSARREKRSNSFSSSGSGR